MDENQTTIAFDDFLKVDIRAGQIVAAERVPKSDKLLKLQVDFGPELGTRQVLAGIGKEFDPDKLSTQQPTAAFVVNLAPRKMMGLESHGMILAAQATNVPDDPGLEVLFLSHRVKPGERIG